MELFNRLLKEEYDKLLKARDKDVFEVSKTTTLPIAKQIVETYIGSTAKVPWFIDLLNINLNNQDLEVAKKRISEYMDQYEKDGTRITENLDFVLTDQGNG